ncbi:MAG: SUMF1/EgtB/PvdO family nonheme iron enzyme [Bacteroidetes bacterium]|nr:SUMF1/EgtB/PvdO family nonheme iron enzyme [Bacteroidota bacterium]
MKKLLILCSFAALVASCSHGTGELVGVLGREEWFQPDPFGMNYIHPGGYNMGPSDEDVTFSHTTKSKTVSVQSFYIDDSEISNNEYRQFVFWVRDSIAHRILIEQGIGEHGVSTNQYDEEIDPPTVNWDEGIEWDDQQVREALIDMYLPESERFYRRKEIDTRKLNFEYYWIDLRTAAMKMNRFLPSKTPDANGQDFIDGKGNYTVTKTVHKGDGFYEPVTKKGVDRSVFIIKDIINVYPDTLAWVHDYTYAFNEPMTNMYFWHPAYDDYPVVGVSWKQARAFCIWRTQLLNSFLQSNGGTFVNDFRLPTEAEWEWAARGDLLLSPYPWGGPYIRNARGCFLCNFKPMRGLYFDDGGFHTVPIYSYNPNDFGLYCMAGNAAEWTSNAFDESAYDFAHDQNSDYVYEAQENEPSVLKRKVIRGGSWKDVGYYCQTSSRTYEYQDTAKCYIGFRCVMTYLGRAKGSDGNADKSFTGGK